MMMMKESESKSGEGGSSRLSPLAQPFTVERSSSLQPSFRASASRSSSHFTLGSSEYEHASGTEPTSYYEPYPSDESFWGSLALDFSFLGCDEQKLVGEDELFCGDEGKTLRTGGLFLGQGWPVAETSKLCGQADYALDRKARPAPVRDERTDLEIMKQMNAESVPKSSKFSESDLSCAVIQKDPIHRPSLALPVMPASHFDSYVVPEDRCSTHSTPASVLGQSDRSSLGNSVLLDNVNSDDSGAKGKLLYAKDKVARFNKILADQSGEKNNGKSITNKGSYPLVSMTSKLRISCPRVSSSDMSVLHGADANLHFEKSSVPSDQNDSDVDSPCWKGTQSYKTAVTAAPMSLEPSNDELNGCYRLNPLAPNFVPANAKQIINKHVEDCKGSGSSSLHEIASSTVALSSCDYSLIDSFEVAQVPFQMSSDVKNHYASEINEPRAASTLLNHSDGSCGFASQVTISKMASIQSSNELQTSNRLNPLAPQFLPAGAKRSAVDHEKQVGVDDMVALQTNVSSTSALSSVGNVLLSNCVKPETCASEISSTVWSHCSSGVHEPGISYLFNNSYRSPSLESEVRISENVSLKPSSDKIHVGNGLNPLAPPFSVASREDKCIADDSLPLMKTVTSADSFIYGDQRVMDSIEVKPQCSVAMTHRSNGLHAPQMECILPSQSHGCSVLVSSVADQSILVEDYFESNNQLVVEPNATLSMRGIADNEPGASFHVSGNVMASSSREVEALSDISPTNSHLSKSTGPRMNAKKLLSTIHELSELLILCSDDLDSLNEQEHVQINNIMKNLNLYIRNRVQKDIMNDSGNLCASYSTEQTANWHRDVRITRTKDMTFKQDLKRKGNCSMVFSEKVLGSYLSSHNRKKSDSISEVIANSALQGNHQTGEEMNPQVLLYRSLWLKAEAARCLMEYEVSLSRMKK